MSANAINTFTAVREQHCEGQWVFGVVHTAHKCECVSLQCVCYFFLFDSTSCCSLRFCFAYVLVVYNVSRRALKLARVLHKCDRPASLILYCVFTIYGNCGSVWHILNSTQIAIIGEGNRHRICVCAYSRPCVRV